MIADPTNKKAPNTLNPSRLPIIAEKNNCPLVPVELEEMSKGRFINNKQPPTNNGIAKKYTNTSIFISSAIDLLENA